MSSIFFLSFAFLLLSLVFDENPFVGIDEATAAAASPLSISGPPITFDIRLYMRNVDGLLASATLELIGGVDAAVAEVSVDGGGVAADVLVDDDELFGFVVPLVSGNFVALSSIR